MFGIYEICLKKVALQVIEEELTRTVKGRDYTFKGQTALCSECGHPVYHDEVTDYNKQIIYKLMKESNHIS